jgi:RimJ/RimL family protein N-acetyltransferase
MSEQLVPDTFDVPMHFETPLFVLEPLGPEHNESDHAAWSSSIEHIRTTPGFALRQWPRPMSSAENLADLEAHSADFDARTAFAYTVLDPGTREVIGCVYLDPDPTGLAEVAVRSWVGASHADLDEPLRGALAAWLERDWPFNSVAYLRE